MSINFGDLSRGLVIELDGQPWQIMDYERHKMQQRAPVTRIKLKNLLSGAVVERTFQRYDTEFSLADMDNRQAQYLYTDGEFFYFLDQETFDQYELTKEILGTTLDYLKEQMIVEVVFYKGSAININLPIHVELAVTETPPSFQGGIPPKEATSQPPWRLASVLTCPCSLHRVPLSGSTLAPEPTPSESASGVPRLHRQSSHQPLAAIPRERPAFGRPVADRRNLQPEGFILGTFLLHPQGRAERAELCHVQGPARCRAPGQRDSNFGPWPRHLLRAQGFHRLYGGSGHARGGWRGFSLELERLRLRVGG